MHFCGLAPERQLLKNSDSPQEKCIFSRIAQKKKFKAHNQTKPQNLAKTWPEIDDFRIRF